MAQGTSAQGPKILDWSWILQKYLFPRVYSLGNPAALAQGDDQSPLGIGRNTVSIREEANIKISQSVILLDEDVRSRNPRDVRGHDLPDHMQVIGQGKSLIVSSSKFREGTPKLTTTPNSEFYHQPFLNGICAGISHFLRRDLLRPEPGCRLLPLSVLCQEACPSLHVQRY